MKVGINISHNTSVCVYDKGKITHLWNEDRFRENKDFAPSADERTHGFRSFENLKLPVKQICFSSFGRTKFEDCSDQTIINNICEQLDCYNYKFNIKHHHLHHAICANYFAKFDEALAIVVDGGGASIFSEYQEYESIFYIKKKKIKKLYQKLSNSRWVAKHDLDKNINVPVITMKRKGVDYELTSQELAGNLFAIDSMLCGFKATHAGKLMGLASYYKKKNKYKLDSEKIKIAHDRQEENFNRSCELIDKALKYKKCKNILLSGGVAMNCVNNFRLTEKYSKLNFFVDPLPMDNGTAIGSVVYHNEYTK